MNKNNLILSFAGKLIIFRYLFFCYYTKKFAINIETYLFHYYLLKHFYKVHFGLRKLAQIWYHNIVMNIKGSRMFYNVSKRVPGKISFNYTINNSGKHLSFLYIIYLIYQFIFSFGVFAT